MKTKKNVSKSIPKEEDRWINVHDDDVMREMGFLRPFLQKPRDESVWSKTNYERKLLKKLRHSVKGKNMHFHIIPCQFKPVRCKLIINLYKNKKFNKTTYSTVCWQHEIPSVLANYQLSNVNLVRKYSWNGKTYKSNELPF